jgi:signal transduction histidine kinase
MTDLPSHNRQENSLVRLIHSSAAARIILVLAVALTISAWYFSKQVVQRAEAEQFEILTNEIETAVHDRMVVYEQVLWGGVGLFNASEDVSRKEWAQYVDALDLDEHWPGIQGLGFAVPVDPADLEAHTAEIRAEGFPDFTVRPESERDELTSIIYLEPFDWRNQRAFGFDMWSNDLRREAMTRARDDNTAATSGVITLVQETDDDVQKGFLTYVPVYAGGIEPTTSAARRDALEGWVYAAFRSDDLMEGILGDGLAGIEYEIFDGPDLTNESLLYDSNLKFAVDSGDDGVLRRSDTLEVQGRQWTIRYEATDDFATGAATQLPNVIGIAGLLIDVLLFYVISSLGLMQKRAVTLAQDMTAELRVRSDELEEQAERLNRSNAELEQFAYIASHDLQEPLRNITSYSSMLSNKYGQTMGEEGQRWLGYLSAGSNQMSDLIRELLHYSTIGSESSTPDLVALDDVVSSAVGSLAGAIEEGGALLALEDMPVVFGHVDQLERLFLNLLANALKYRKAGTSPHIWVSAVESETEWRISVRDDGIGIKPEYHERIFEIFRRVGSRADYPGTGIGLSICRKIVENHGGSIGVDSSLGGGSEFWFELPRPAPDRPLPSDSPPTSKLAGSLTSS